MITRYKIMVIDDEFKYGDESRKKVIEKYFSNDWLVGTDIKNKDRILKLLPIDFELVFVSTWDEFAEKITKHNIHAFFIDFNLVDNNRVEERGDFKINTKNFNDVLNKIKEKGENKPIIIYSGMWSDKLIGNLLEDFNVVFGDRVPTRIMTYSVFENTIVDLQLYEEQINELKISNLRNERESIWEMIAKSQEGVDFCPYSQEGDITILHISDLQFGDKKTTENAMGIWGNMIEEIQSYLHKEKNIENIDLVIITGDIAMYGKKEEFKEAFQEFEKFFEQLWGKNYSKDRIIVVPGNHDFDINSCVLEYFKAENISRDERKINFDLVANQIKNKKKIGEYNELGLYEFRKFAYQLTQNDQYILSDNLNFIIDKFNNWGLRFLCLNTLDGITADRTNHVGINRDGLKAITDMPKRENDFLTIVLAHHTPLSEDLLSEEEKEMLKKDYETLQRSMRVKLVMGGHRHMNDTGSRRNSAEKTMKIIESASLRVEDTDEKYIRGFGVLTIKHDMSEALVKYFDFNKSDGVIQREDKDISFTFK